MDKAEKGAREIVERFSWTADTDSDAVDEFADAIATALRQRDEETAKWRTRSDEVSKALLILKQNLREVVADRDHARAERDACVAALKTISALKTQTLLCDPGDYDFNAEDAYQGGAHNAFCQAAEEADAALAQIKKESSDGHK